MPTTPVRPSDPELLGRYRIVGRLGRGGMGTVYLGEDETTGRRVAVKVINPELADDAAFHERFRREVIAARQVRRFCTAAVLDARLDGEPLYVVTEYVDGPTLDEAVRERGPLSGGALEGLAVNIATALGAIHGAGVVHRDLKPTNVLLSSTGPRVIDFGIARALDAVDGLTRTGQFIGTPSYIAPELMRGGEITPAADVFSWGCVVAYAGTTRAPFTGGTIHEIIHRVFNEAPVLDDLDPDLRGLVERALDKDPARRPATADLLRELTGQADPIPPASSALGAAPAALTQPVGRPDTTAEPAAAQRRPGRRRVIGGTSVGAVAVAAIVAAAVLFLNTEDAGQKTNDDGPPKPGAVLLKDDFNDPASGWPNGSGDCAGYQDNGYLLDILAAAGAAETCTASKPSAQVPRSLVDVQVKLATGPQEGAWEAGLLLLKASGSDDGYNVVLRQNGTARLVKTSGNGFTELANVKAPGFKAGAFNRLQAELDLRGGNPRIVLWVNGRKTFEHTDTDRPLRQGTTGLVLYDAGARERVAVTFDDFRVYRVD